MSCSFDHSSPTNRVRIRIHPDVTEYPNLKQSARPRLRSALDLCMDFPSPRRIHSPSNPSSKKEKNKRKKKTKSAAQQHHQECTPQQSNRNSPMSTALEIIQSVSPPQSAELQQIEVEETIATESHVRAEISHNEARLYAIAVLSLAETTHRLRIERMVPPLIFSTRMWHWTTLEVLRREKVVVTEWVEFCAVRESDARAAVMRCQREGFHQISSWRINALEKHLRHATHVSEDSQYFWEIAMKILTQKEMMGRQAVGQHTWRVHARYVIVASEITLRVKSMLAEASRFRAAAVQCFLGYEPIHRRVILTECGEGEVILLGVAEVLLRKTWECETDEAYSQLEVYHLMSTEHARRGEILTCERDEFFFAIVIMNRVCLETLSRNVLHESQIKMFSRLAWPLHHFVDAVTEPSYFSDDLYQFGIPKGKVCDLARANAFQGLRLLIGHFQHSRTVFASEWLGVVPLTFVIGVLKTKGWEVDIVADQNEFAARLLTGYRTAWILSTDEFKMVCGDFPTSLTAFHKSGGGLVIWGQNDPWCRTCMTSIILPKRFGFKLQGSPLRDCCTTVDRSPMISEAMVCHLSDVPGGFTVVNSASSAHPVLMESPANGGRVVFDCGSTQMWTQYWKGDGVPRYVSNSVSWAANCDPSFYNPSESAADFITSTVQIESFSVLEAEDRFRIAKAEDTMASEFRVILLPSMESRRRGHVVHAEARKRKRDLTDNILRIEALIRGNLRIDALLEWEPAQRSAIALSAVSAAMVAYDKFLVLLERLMCEVTTTQEASEWLACVQLQASDAMFSIAHLENALFQTSQVESLTCQEEIYRVVIIHRMEDETAKHTFTALERTQREDLSQEESIHRLEVKTTLLAVREEISRNVILRWEEDIVARHIWPKPVCPHWDAPELCSSATCCLSHVVDDFGNPKGSNYDLACDDAFDGMRVIIGFFPFSHTLDWLSATALASVITELKKKGWEVDVVRQEIDFASKLSKGFYRVAWIMSNNVFKRDKNDKVFSEKSFTETVKKFYKRGGGLVVWGQNHSFVVHANLILAALFGGLILEGSTPGGAAIVTGDAYTPGHFSNHPAMQGILHFYEGAAMCAPSMVPENFTVVANSSAGLPVILAGPRIVIDCAWTRLWAQNWARAGTPRYVSNITAWVASMEDSFYNPGMPMADFTKEGSDVREYIMLENGERTFIMEHEMASFHELCQNEITEFECVNRNICVQSELGGLEALLREFLSNAQARNIHVLRIMGCHDAIATHDVLEKRLRGDIVLSERPLRVELKNENFLRLQDLRRDAITKEESTSHAEIKRSATDAIHAMNMEARVKGKGVKSSDLVSAKGFMITLVWDLDEDLDMWLIMPGSKKVSCGEKAKSVAGVILNADSKGANGVENIMSDDPPPGEYIVQVQHYSSGSVLVPFTVRVVLRGRAEFYNLVTGGTKTVATVCTFALP